MQIVESLPSVPERQNPNDSAPERINNPEISVHFAAMKHGAYPEGGCYNRAYNLAHRLLELGFDTARLALITIIPVKNGDCLRPHHPGVTWYAGHVVLEIDGLIHDPLEDGVMPWEQYRRAVFGDQPLEMHRTACCWHSRILKT